MNSLRLGYARVVLFFEDMVEQQSVEVLAFDDDSNLDGRVGLVRLVTVQVISLFLLSQNLLEGLSLDCSGCLHRILEA